MAYNKLFSSIVTSTLWLEDDQTRIVWITMLAIADKNGEVQASIPGLARLAGVSVEACETAITKFLSPDKHSRTKDEEGRRIEEIDGGWFLLNHPKYRAMASRDEARAANAERQKRFRERRKRNHSSEAPPAPPAEAQEDPQPALGLDQSPQPERKASSLAAVPTWEEVKQLASMRCIPEASARAFFDHHEGKNLWFNRHERLINWPHELNTWAVRDRQNSKPQHGTTNAQFITPPPASQPSIDEVLRRREAARLQRLPPAQHPLAAKVAGTGPESSQAPGGG